MDYNKILKLSREKEFSKKALAEAILMTPQGLRHMFDHETMTVVVLEKISKTLGVSPCYWWKEEPNAFNVSEAESGYLTRPDNNYIHRDAFNHTISTLQQNFNRERDMMSGQIEFLQNLVNQSITGKTTQHGQ